jgi:tetratricopeptide (TPR) repeat protein
MKESEQYDQAIKNLEELLTDYPGTEVAGPAVDELNQVAALKREKEQQLLKAQINEAASDVMEEARANQRGGLYQEALKGYETIVRNYIESDYTNEAVSQIVKINRDLRSANSGSLIVTSDVSKVGVIIKLSPDDSFLFNLGTRDGVKEGQVLGIYRKEDGEMGFIGNVKITDVYPTISKGMIMFSDQDLRVGDIISSAG